MYYPTNLFVNYDKQGIFGVVWDKINKDIGDVSHITPMAMWILLIWSSLIVSCKMHMEILIAAK